jgi:hypothetical protein
VNESGVSPVYIIPPWFSMFIHYLGDEQKGRWWSQYRDVVSPHRHDDDDNDHRHHYKLYTTWLKEPGMIFRAFWTIEAGRSQLLDC